MARKPSHLGSYAQPSPDGRAERERASCGRRGRVRGRATDRTLTPGRVPWPDRFLELTAVVAAGVGAMAECHDVERAERGHERDERDHDHMIGHERGRT